ncbi:hypothetical protein ACFE04_029328 [Oxalis oulophora]
MDLNFNLTWKMDVDPNFDYMMRLHFCDIISMRANDLWVRFLMVIQVRLMLAKSLDGFITVDGTDMSSTTPCSTKMKVVAGTGLSLAPTCKLFLGAVFVKWKRRPEYSNKYNQDSNKNNHNSQIALETSSIRKHNFFP